MQTGQYDVKKLDKYETFLTPENDYAARAVEVNSLPLQSTSDASVSTISSSIVSSQSTTKQSIGSSTTGDDKPQDDKITDNSEADKVEPIENGTKIESKIPEGTPNILTWNQFLNMYGGHGFSLYYTNCRLCSHKYLFTHPLIRLGF